MSVKSPRPPAYSVLLSDSAHDPARERAALELYQQLRVRGVILAPVSSSPEEELSRRLDMPVVLADRFAAYHDACTVSVDDFVGGQLAAQHLLERGHRRLAAVGGTADIAQVRERRDGAGRAVLLGDPDATLLTLSTERLDIEAGRTAALDIVAMPDDERPTGVFALNDLVAIGLLQGLVTHKVAVPEEISIVGYDDIEFAAAAAVPLSSVSQPRVELGRRAAELLLDEMRRSRAENRTSTSRNDSPRPSSFAPPPSTSASCRAPDAGNAHALGPVPGELHACRLG